MTNLDNTLKSRDITLPTKVCLIKAMVFPVIMYGCESWTIKNAVQFSLSVVSNSCGPMNCSMPGLPVHQRKLSAKQLMLLNCGVGEDSWESLELQGDQTSQS